MSIVNAALSIREERVAISVSPRARAHARIIPPPSPSLPGNRAWIYEPSLGLAV